MLLLRSTAELRSGFCDKNMQPYIYKVTDLRNGKMVIGKTNGNDKYYFTGSVIINRTIKKNGGRKWAKQFLKKEIIVQGDFNDALLSELEKHYIRLYNTKDPYGYNLTDGGDGVVGQTEETREKIRRKNLGRKMSKETMDKVSHTFFPKGHVPWVTTVKGTGILKANSGSFKKGETRPTQYRFKKGNKSNVGKKYTIIKDGRNGNSIKIAQLSLSKEVIKIWPSPSQAGRELGIKHISPLRRVANGEYKKSHGFIWRHVDENNNIIEP